MGKSAQPQGWNGGGGNSYQSPTNNSQASKNRSTDYQPPGSLPKSYQQQTVQPRMMDGGTQSNGMYTGGGYGLPSNPVNPGPPQYRPPEDDQSPFVNPGPPQYRPPDDGDSPWVNPGPPQYRPEQSGVVGPKMMDGGTQSNGMYTGGGYGLPQGQQGGGRWGAMIRALLGGQQGQQGQQKDYIPGVGWTFPNQPGQPGPSVSGQPVGGSPPVNPGPPQQIPTTPTTPGAVNPLFAAPTSGSSTGAYNQAGMDWAKKLAQQNPGVAGQSVSPLDYNTLSPDGKYNGPVPDGWQRSKGYDPSGYFGFKDNAFWAGGVPQVGMMHGWDKPGTPAYDDAMQRLKSQFRIGIPG